MIRNTSEFSHPEPNSQKEILSVLKMKMRGKSNFETVKEIPLVELESQIRDEGKLTSILFIGSGLYFISRLTHFHSLVSMASESIIPEWFFQTTKMIEPERIEFKNDTKF